MDEVAPQAPRHEPLQPGAVGPWLREGARSALFLDVRWTGLHAHPAVLLFLVLAQLALAVLVERLCIPGPATFFAGALLTGWIAVAAMGWVSYLMCPPAGVAADGIAPGAAHLFAMFVAQDLFITAAGGAVLVVLAHAEAVRWIGTGGWWAVALGCCAWLLLAQLGLLRMHGAGRRGAVAVGFAVLLGSGVLLQWALPWQLWYPEQPAVAAAGEPAEEDERPMLHLDQATMEAQPELLAERLDELKPQRPGVVDLYAITFAPEAEEDVFRRESEMVAGVMQQRFDAVGRTVQLVNHVDTLEQWPWATPLNLERAIHDVAQRMDRDEDVLFIHLTSHGARDGQLAASFYPMEVDEVTPEDLRRWLDEAGIRWRVISISACFSGSWLAPLAGEGTLVMTAADADHTSYGCGRRSPLTFFGRAMYDEQLRTRTLSFEQAHAAARTVIAQREQQAGKDDGYSNPQISMGTAIRERLRQLQDRLERR